MPCLNMYNPFVECFAIRILVLVTPIEVKKHFLTHIYTSLADTMRILSEIHI